MALTLGDNFSYQGAKPLDARLKYDTVAAMKAVGDSTMYDGCLAYCTATDKTYQWKSTNTVDSTTGRWREFSSGGSSEDENAYHTTDTAETAIADADYFPFYDSSASAKRKSLWSNIKSVLKTYFDSLYQKTLTAGTNISFSGTNSDVINASMPVLGTINRSDIYDTTEKVVGKWTDGRPLYQKTISFGALPNATYKSASHGISNCSKIIDISGYATNGGAFIPIGGFDRDNATVNNLKVRANNNNIFIATTVDLSAFTECYVTLQYTKTTDAANSYNYADENDYSTSEKIIGTWTNGATLYQKTYTLAFTVTSASAWQSFNVTSISGVWIKEYSGYIDRNDDLIIPLCCDVDDGARYAIRTNSSNNSIKLTVYTTGNTSNASGTLYLTIKYTKS